MSCNNYLKNNCGRSEEAAEDRNSCIKFSQKYPDFHKNIEMVAILQKQLF